MTALTKLEQETQINFNAEDANCCLYTADPVMIRRVDRLRAQRPEAFRLLAEIKAADGVTIIAKDYTFSKSLVSIRPKRKMSEAQRIAAMASMARAQEALRNSRLSEPSIQPPNP